MCGITGYYKFVERSSLNLKAATNAITHRGPDSVGYYEDEIVGLGHRRLSILDLTSTGFQPMYSNNKRFIIIFNGEIYNYRSIRDELNQLGYQFDGTSDTEVIINGFEIWGNNIFKKLNGIFSIAIFDKSEQKLTLARDRLGVKPLYYFKNEVCFAFGSEIKSLLKYECVNSTLNHHSFHEFIYYGYGLGEKTMYNDIFKLEPGSLIEISKNSYSISYYWKHEDVILQSEDNISLSEAVSRTKVLLEEAVKSQLVSDVPVGVFLSGGIDSSAITAFASKHYAQKLKTFSAGFDFDEGHNELPLAAKVAKQFDTDHSEIFIKGKDLPAIIEQMVLQHDEPFSDAANIPLYLMTKEIKQRCKVILQGDGGDELFGGYPRYHMLHNLKWYKLLFSSLNFFEPLIPSKYVREKTKRFYPIFTSNNNLFAKLLTEDQEDIPELSFSKELRFLIKDQLPFIHYSKMSKRFDYLEDDVQKLLWIDTKIILPDQFLEKVDKSTMANGVEVRVPFLDNHLVEFALSLPSKYKLHKGIKKYLLKKALEGTVPNEVLYGPKKGFGVPYQNWLRGPLKEFMKDMIYSQSIKDKNLFDYKVLTQRIEEHCTNKTNWGFHLWKILNFCIWIDKYSIEVNSDK
jgi:asparagine synthase (glutamine-hydrolysing)